jgi:enamine deaminase RidA (YjgF/YER057c/UK114 family)
VDEEGRTAHVDEFAPQVERMLLNIETLLAAQHASFQNVVSAVTYLKTAADAPAFQRVLNNRGLADLPNLLVHAAVCRPDLLCEMEAIAALPLI